MGNGGMSIQSAHESSGGSGTVTLTGNVTGSGTGSFVTTIAAGAVTNAMLAGSIASGKLVGTDIATVGTITAGVWHATLIGVLYGGSGADLSATGGPRQIVKQATAGGALTVGILDRNDVPQFYHRSIWQTRANATSIDSIGDAAPTATGTAAAVSDSTGVYTTYTSSTTINTNAGLQDYTAAAVGTENLPVHQFAFYTGADISSVRYWCGMVSGNPMGSATPSVSLAALRYDTAADGTAFWRFVTDNGSGTPNVVVTTVAVAVSTRYEVMIDASDPTSIKCWINGVLAATSATTLPATSTKLAKVVQIRTLTNAARVIGFSKSDFSYR